MTSFRLFMLPMLFSLLAVPAAAQAPWPDFMARLAAAPSNSPVQAVLPDNVVITPPTPDLPQDIAVWSGRWAGYSCRNFVCDTRLAVTEVRPDGASVIYTYGYRHSSGPRIDVQRVEMKFIGKEMIGNLASGSFITYRLRNQGEMEFKWSNASGSEWQVGVLVREQAAAAPVHDLVKPFLGNWRGEWIFYSGHGRASAYLTVAESSNPERVPVTYFYNGQQSKHFGRIAGSKLLLDFGANGAEYALTANEGQLAAIYKQGNTQSANAVMRRE